MSSNTLEDNPATGEAAAQTADDVAGRVLQSAIGAAETMAIYLGDRLGWYRSLAADGPATATELAERTGTNPRYAREWLEQQAVSGLLVAEDSDDAETRRFEITDAVAEAMTDERSLAYISPLTRMFAAVGPQLPALLDAYRTGGGVSWKQLGEDAREGQADMNRPWFDKLPSVFADIGHLHDVLSSPTARIADVGMGAGWSSIALAQAYPSLTVHGFDIDDASVELATANALDAGVADRVRFHLAGGDALEAHGPFDAAFAFECIHDMSQPVDVLRAMRRAVSEDGLVIIMDEAVGDRFGVPGAELDALMYAFSLFVCLPDGMSHQPSAATGTVMRPDTLLEYAQAAGFEDLTILPIEDFGLWRFYELLGRRPKAG
jgi:predicted O-methyltransferase YrrM